MKCEDRSRRTVFVHIASIFFLLVTFVTMGCASTDNSREAVLERIAELPAAGTEEPEGTRRRITSDYHNQDGEAWDEEAYGQWVTVFVYITPASDLQIVISEKTGGIVDATVHPTGLDDETRFRNTWNPKNDQ